MAEQEPVSFEAYYEPIETWFEVRAYPLPTGLSVYFRDVTEQKEPERRLTEREETLEEVYRVIADKITEFDEKVAALLDIGQRVLDADAAALSRIEDDEYIFEIVSDESLEPGDTVPLAATNCERVAADEQTLALTDIESQAPELTDKAGFTEMSTEWLSFETVATDAWNTVETDTATLSVERSGMLVADAGHLRQLFENLFRNSVEHGSTDSSREGEESEERCPESVTIRAGMLDERDGFYVADDGPGIAPEDRETVFESGHTTADGGTGFGLGIVAEIVDAHDGTVSVTDSADSGARFEVTGTPVKDR